MTISAVFQEGVFKPSIPIQLREGEEVQLEVIRSAPPSTRLILSLKGIWKHALRPDDTGDWVTEAISEIRNESARKFERLAQELNENSGYD
ncbi:MAG: antitoxin family protein [Caldilineaceae bacterium]|nr:antitoxin family protein [Caldilineaceae bacterium]HRJ41922.1 antitoxin family protein [Caldilineaceae bacterium]